MLQKMLDLHPKTMELIDHTLKWAKRKKYKFIVNPCGEICLSIMGGYCVIGDLCLANVENKQDAINAARLMARFLIRVNLMPSLYGSEVARTNRIGVGLTGIHEFAYSHFGLTFTDLIDEEKSFEFWAFIGEMRRAVEASAVDYAEEIGAFPQAFKPVIDYENPLCHDSQTFLAFRYPEASGNHITNLDLPDWPTSQITSPPFAFARFLAEKSPRPLPSSLVL